MPNPVQHFEIYGEDPEKLGKFYSGLFGWKISPVEGMEYWMLGTVPTNEKGHPTEPGGINGGLMKRPMPEARGWLNYVTVASLEESVKKAEGLGAKVIRPKSPVPKMGWFAVLVDPQQNPFAMWQNDPNAG
jgi:predicted enzyme related to lactoylglutathione lyase